MACRARWLGQKTELERLPLLYGIAIPTKTDMLLSHIPPLCATHYNPTEKKKWQKVPKNMTPLQKKKKNSRKKEKEKTNKKEEALIILHAG